MGDDENHGARAQAGLRSTAVVRRLQKSLPGRWLRKSNTAQQLGGYVHLGAYTTADAERQHTFMDTFIDGH